MKALVQSTRSLTAIIEINVDRLLVPLLIIAALTLAGWLFSYATVSLGA